MSDGGTEMSDLKPGTSRITVETVRAGQPRPYADSVYEYIMTLEWIPYGNSEDGFQPRKLAKDAAMAIAKGACRNFYEKKDKPEWHLPILQSMTEIDTGKWNLIIKLAYTG